jgi:transposase
MAKKIQVKQILELRAAGLSQNNITRSRHMSKSSVSDVFQIAQERGIAYEDVRDMRPEEVYRLFYPDKHAVETLFQEPDYEYVHGELSKVGVTLKLLWKEYRDQCFSVAGGVAMGYTKFCTGYTRFTEAKNLTNHLTHKPGVVTEVDWSGPTMKLVDRMTGRDNHRLSVCCHAALQPILLCGALPQYEGSILAQLPYPHVRVFRRHNRQDSL